MKNWNTGLSHWAWTELRDKIPGSDERIAGALSHLAEAASTSTLLTVERSTVCWCPFHSVRISWECFNSNVSFYVYTYSPAGSVGYVKGARVFAALSRSLNWKHILKSHSKEDTCQFNLLFSPTFNLIMFVKQD